MNKESWENAARQKTVDGEKLTRFEIIEDALSKKPYSSCLLLLMIILTLCVLLFL